MSYTQADEQLQRDLQDIIQNGAIYMPLSAMATDINCNDLLGIPLGILDHGIPGAKLVAIEPDHSTHRCASGFSRLFAEVKTVRAGDKVCINGIDVEIKYAIDRGTHVSLFYYLNEHAYEARAHGGRYIEIVSLNNGQL